MVFYLYYEILNSFFKYLKLINTAESKAYKYSNEFKADIIKFEAKTQGYLKITRSEKFQWSQFNFFLHINFPFKIYCGRKEKGRDGFFIVTFHNPYHFTELCTLFN